MSPSATQAATEGGSTYHHDESDPSSTESTSGELNQWKFRAPYKIHENDPNFKALYHGSCHCERIKFQLSRESPLAAKYCHCQTCQKLHGAPFQWCAIFHKEDINFLSGHHDLGWYESSEKTCVHKLPCKVSCAYCRTPIMDEGRNMILMFPTLIDWENDEDKAKFAAQCHMFYPRRVVDINDGLPKWSGINDQSELIADTPEEHKRKREAELAEQSKRQEREKNQKGVSGGEEVDGK